MKRLFLYALCMSCTYLSMGQTQHFIQVQAGACASRQLITSGGNEYPQYGPGYNAGISAGIIKNRWTLSAGISYQTWQASKETYQEDPYFKSGTIQLVKVKHLEKHKSLMVPLSVSYNLVSRSGSKWNIAPFAGLAASYNYSSEFRTEGGYPMMTCIEEDRSPTTWSLWGKAGIGIGYQLNRKIQVSAGPEAAYMFTSFLQNRNIRQHTLMTGGSIGMRYVF